MEELYVIINADKEVIVAKNGKGIFNKEDVRKVYDDLVKENVYNFFLHRIAKLSFID